MRQVAVIGAGIIGSSWAVLFARNGIQVSLQDNSPDQLARLPALLESMVKDSFVLLKPGEDVQDVISRIHITTCLEDAVVKAEYVQEAISESVQAKEQIFSALDRICQKDVILASSSSTYGVSYYAKSLLNRSRCIVVHPMTPPHLMPIIEVVPAPFTDGEVVNKSMEFMRQIKQHPVLINKEVDGFVLNRLQGALLLEMFQVINEGLMSASDVDAIIRYGLGLRWATLGPIQGIDLNAPQGIGDYLTRYGHIFNEMGKCRGDKTAPVTQDLVERLQTEMRLQLPLQDLNKRRAWRDKAIASIRKTLDSMQKECV